VERKCNISQTASKVQTWELWELKKEKRGKQKECIIYSTK
jgi:hypothetical protein